MPTMKAYFPLQNFIYKNIVIYKVSPTKEFTITCKLIHYKITEEKLCR